MEQALIDSGNSINLAIQDHHLIKKYQILCLNKLDSNELYNIQLQFSENNYTSLF